MKFLIQILTLIILFNSCRNEKDSSSIIHNDSIDSNVSPQLMSDDENIPIIEDHISLLVIPSYDNIANRGISPKIPEMIEDELSGINGLSVIPFSYKEFANVQYQQIYDKKYLKPILNRVNADVVIMTKLDLAEETGRMDTDKWNVKIKYYFYSTGKQIESQLKLNNLTSSKIKEALKINKNKILKEVTNNTK